MQIRWYGTDDIENDDNDNKHWQHQQPHYWLVKWVYMCALFLNNANSAERKQGSKKIKGGTDERTLPQWHWTTIVSNLLACLQRQQQQQQCHGIQWAKENKWSLFAIRLYTMAAHITAAHSHFIILLGKLFLSLLLLLLPLLLLLLHEPRDNNIWLHISFIIKFIFASLDNYLNSQTKQSQMNQTEPSQAKAKRNVYIAILMVYDASEPYNGN